MIDNGSALSNDDLLPSPQSERDWVWEHYTFLWLGMVICIPAYLLAGGLMEQGLSPLAAIGAILLGNLIVLIPMALIGHAGARYGIPFAVLARASFGTGGAKLAAFARAIVACGWYGIQTWVGGNTLLALGRRMGLGGLHGAPLPVVGISAVELGAFLLFWALQLLVVTKGMRAVRRFETWTAPAKVALLLALFVWAIDRLGGVSASFSRIAHAGGTATSGQSFWALFVPSVTAMVGFWATLSLNIPDFTRFARSQRDQMLGQALGLPIPMALLGLVSIVTGFATMTVYGVAIHDPLALADRMTGWPVLLGLLIISIDTVSCNIAANLVGPAYDFSAIWPRHISYRGGAMITAVIGVVIMPWKLVATSSGYIFTWLIGYSALLGPVGSIILVDYWIVRGGRLDAQALYDEAGQYAYRGGVNPAALAALAIGVAPSLPGFIAAVAPATAPAISALLTALYPYAWFVGFLVSGTAYALLARAGDRHKGVIGRKARAT